MNIKYNLKGKIYELDCVNRKNALTRRLCDWLICDEICGQCPAYKQDNFLK